MIVHRDRADRGSRVGDGPDSEAVTVTVAHRYGDWQYKLEGATVPAAHRDC